MNRRSLFKLLAGAACAAAIELTGLRPMMPKAALYVINPEYVNADYEDMYLVSKDSSFALRLTRKPLSSAGDALVMPPMDNATAIGSPEALAGLPKDFNTFPDGFMPRYNFINGQYVQVPNYILQS
jgi:hypothetical protein